MKRSGFKFKPRKPLKRSLLRIKGVSDTATTKQDIQDLVRAIVIERDGGCILREVYGVPPCNGYRKRDGALILQADHLITRANSATYADPRLIVCVCKGHHEWKNWNKEEYDALLKTILPRAIVELWERCEQDSWRANRMGAYDWKLAKVDLEQQLAKLTNKKEIL